MRVLIVGVDGYLGWALAQHLAAQGHVVGGIDNLQRRSWVAEMGSISAVPISSHRDRTTAFNEKFGTALQFFVVDVRDHPALCSALRKFEPDAVVHLAECPSAAYSMIDFCHANYVQQNNVSGTLSLLFALRDHAPECHLVKLGTMGEYGTPDIPIPEGFFEVRYRGRRDRLPFPRQAGSWYHWSKVFDSHNVAFACQLWGLRATDVMQGIVYGSWCNADPRLNTRLDFDEAFGTIVNRFSCQAVIGEPLTPYGKGGQRRGFLTLTDSMRCLRIAIDNPPNVGEYRVFNQFSDVLTVSGVAELVRSAGVKLGFDVEIKSASNPRVEAESHFYQPDNDSLRALGFASEGDPESAIGRLISDLLPHRNRIADRADCLRPTVLWRNRDRGSVQH